MNDPKIDDAVASENKRRMKLTHDLLVVCRELGIEPLKAAKLLRWHSERPHCLRVGPGIVDTTLTATVEVGFSTGETVIVILDPAHARAAKDRMGECLDGTINKRPPSRRVLTIDIAEAANDTTIDVEPLSVTVG